MEKLRSARVPRFVDAWPINFFRPETYNHFDTTCLFLLQLACILQMTREWHKHSMLRVFLCMDEGAAEMSGKEERLRDLLSQLRIRARIQPVFWGKIVEKMDSVDGVFVDDMNKSPDVPKPRTSRSGSMSWCDFDPDKPSITGKNITPYLAAVNELISSQSSANTAVTFLYLPKPPLARGRDDRKYKSYYTQLDTLTANLPPTLLVHGLHSVTSATL